MTEDELDLVETKSLIDALYRRLGERGALIIVSQDCIEDSPHEDKIVNYRGGWSACLGLLEYGKYRLLQSTQEIDLDE